MFKYFNWLLTAKFCIKIHWGRSQTPFIPPHFTPIFYLTCFHHEMLHIREFISVKSLLVITADIGINPARVLRSRRLQ